MMEKKVHRQLLSDALKSLADGRLNDAHIIMRTLCSEVGDTDITNRFESIESDYRAMLDFVAMGGQDPDKDKNYRNLITRTFILLASIERELILSPYSTQFNEIGCADLLSCYWTYAPEKLGKLLDSLDNIDGEEDCLSLIGVILSCMLHPETFKLCPDLRDRVEGIMMDERNQELILFIYTEIFQSSLAEKIEQHFKDEMMPLMIEAAKDPRLQQEIAEEMEGDDEEDSFEKLMKQQELTPLTPEQRRKKKKLNNAMNELKDIHSEGMDVNAEIFNFAARMPFFSEMANWFLEFDPHHPAIEHICYPNGRPNILFRMIYDMPSLCDIDRYAMTFILAKNFKSTKMNVMVAQVQNIIAESESLHGLDFVVPVKSTKAKTTNFIRTLYRFVVKSKWKNELPNVFTNALPYCSDELLSIPLRKNPEAAIELGDKMWKFGAKDEAVKMYKLSEMVSGRLDLQRCLRIAKYYDEIFSNDGDEYVDKAFEMDPIDKDVLLAVARKHERHADFESRIKILKTLVDLFPEDANAICDLADAYIYKEQWDKANQLLFKLEYNDIKTIYAQRRIVLCSLNQSKFDVALKYSRKLFNTPQAANWNDYLKGGHAAWLSGDMTSALTFYHLYIKHYLTDDAKITDALSPFNEDKELLLKLGKTETDISLMRDMITLKAI